MTDVDHDTSDFDGNGALDAIDAIDAIDEIPTAADRTGYDSGEPGAEQSPIAVGPEFSDDDRGDTCCVTTDRSSYDLPGSDEWAPQGSLVLQLPDGSVTDFGVPTLDVDGNGIPDSTVAYGDDGTGYLIMDVTGDNLADGALIVDGAGNVISGFELDANGQPVVVQVPEGMNIAELIRGTVPDGNVDPQPAPQPARPQDTIEPASELAPERTEVSGLGEPGGNVVLNHGGQLVDLGPATEDLDGNGVPESVLVNSPDGQTAWVVTELDATGRTDSVMVINPVTYEIVQAYIITDGVAEDATAEARGEVAPSTDPAPVPGSDERGQVQPTTSGPEQIVAPGAESVTNSSLAITYQSTQRMYDIASQVWFDLTGGEPYPRTDTGVPRDPGMVFAMLQDHPDVPDSYDDELSQMQQNWNNTVAVWVS